MTASRFNQGEYCRGFPSLQTARLCLEPLTNKDAPFVAQLRSDPQVRAFLGGPVSKEKTLKRFEGKWQRLNEWAWVMRLAAPPHEAIGLISLTPHHHPEDMELSYEVLPPFWGQGLAQEASEQVLDFAFHKLELPSIVAETQFANQPSRRLLEKLGFALETTLERFGETQALYRVQSRF